MDASPSPCQRFPGRADLKAKIAFQINENLKPKILYPLAGECPPEEEVVFLFKIISKMIVSDGAWYKR